jgi:hypothetical protein
MTNEKVSELGKPPLSNPSQENVPTKTGAEGGSSESTSVGSSNKEKLFAHIRKNEFAGRVWTFVTWTPKRCRWDPEDPPKFSMALNLLFGFVSDSFLSVVHCERS